MTKNTPNGFFKADLIEYMTSIAELLICLLSDAQMENHCFILRSLVQLDFCWDVLETKI